MGTAFLPADRREARRAVEQVEKLAAEEGLQVLGWRDVPTQPGIVGETARSTMPQFRQLFLAAAGAVPDGDDGLALERMAFCLRKRAERGTDVYFPSLSSRTIVYKGMLTTGQLEEFFPTSPTSG